MKELFVSQKPQMMFQVELKPSESQRRLLVMYREMYGFVYNTVRSMINEARRVQIDIEIPSDRDFADLLRRMCLKENRVVTRRIPASLFLDASRTAINDHNQSERLGIDSIRCGGNLNERQFSLGSEGVAKYNLSKIKVRGIEEPIQLATKVTADSRFMPTIESSNGKWYIICLSSWS